jgi:hypothetical protein
MGIFSRLFRRGNLKENLIRGLVKRRVQNNRVADMLGDVDSIPNQLLMGLPEATIVTIVETYWLMKKKRKYV